MSRGAASSPTSAARTAKRPRKQSPPVEPSADRVMEATARTPASKGVQTRSARKRVARSAPSDADLPTTAPLPTPAEVVAQEAVLPSASILATTTSMLAAALSPISAEQKVVVDAVMRGCNVLVDSVAGSGKTTCNLHIAAALQPGERMLLMTYNQRLKTETRHKIEQLGLADRVVAHNYHTVCGTLYEETPMATDRDIYISLQVDHAPRSPPLDYDVVVVDEAQDMTPMYYQLVVRIMADNVNPRKRICVFGDKNQSLYQFMYSNDQFLTRANQIFQFSPGAADRWVCAKLSVTYRVPASVTELINTAYLGETRLIPGGSTPAPRPRYVLFARQPEALGHAHISAEQAAWRQQQGEEDDGASGYHWDGSMSHSHPAAREFRYYHDELGILPDEMFILAPSVLSTRFAPNYLQLLENYIKRHFPSVQVIVTLSESERLEDRVVQNKLVMTTFHQSKGLERKVVMIFGLDAAGYAYMDNLPYDTMTNTHYVAMTRTFQYLSLMHEETQPFVPYLHATVAPVIGKSDMPPVRGGPRGVVAAVDEAHEAAKRARHVACLRAHAVHADIVLPPGPDAEPVRTASVPGTSLLYQPMPLSTYFLRAATSDDLEAYITNRFLPTSPNPVSVVDIAAPRSTTVNTPQRVSVSKLLRFCPTGAIEQALGEVEFVETSPIDVCIDIENYENRPLYDPRLDRVLEFSEQVAWLNGVVVESCIETRARGRWSLLDEHTDGAQNIARLMSMVHHYEWRLQQRAEVFQNEVPILTAEVVKAHMASCAATGDGAKRRPNLFAVGAQRRPWRALDFALFCTLHDMFTHRYVFRWRQFHSYQYIDDVTLAALCDRYLARFCPADTASGDPVEATHTRSQVEVDGRVVEKQVAPPNYAAGERMRVRGQPIPGGEWKNNEVAVHGRVDFVHLHSRTLVELKCVQTLTQEHKVQLLIYMALARMQEAAMRRNRPRYLAPATEMDRYVLYNVLTDQTLECRATDAQLEAAIKLLIEGRYRTVVQLTEVPFLELCGKIWSAYMDAETCLPWPREVRKPFVHEDLHSVGLSREIQLLCGSRRETTCIGEGEAEWNEGEAWDQWMGYTDDGVPTTCALAPVTPRVEHRADEDDDNDDVARASDAEFIDSDDDLASLVGEAGDEEYGEESIPVRS